MKCFECFNENLQIRKRIYPQENTIEYAEALNCMASYEIDNRKWDEAIKKIKTAIDIVEKLQG